MFKDIKTVREYIQQRENRIRELLDKKALTADEEAEISKNQREYDFGVKSLQKMVAEEQLRSSAPKAKMTLTRQLREAIQNNERSITVQGYTVGEDQRVAGVHDDLVEEQVQGILEPLYANSVLSKLGVRFYPGLPQGDIRVPVMGKGTVGWEGEVSGAKESKNSTTHIKFSPKRITAFCDISKQLILQDTIGVEESIKRDLAKAVQDCLEATIFGNAAGTDVKPKGMFNGKELTEATDFNKICNIEATVEDNNVTGDMKYLLSTGAKADLRSMAKSNNGGNVMEHGSVDGTDAIVTSNVKTAGSFIYGNFSNLAVGSWGDVEITIDTVSQAVNGCIRLVVNAFFDAKVLRSEAFAFGKTRA